MPRLRSDFPQGEVFDSKLKRKVILQARIIPLLLALNLFDLLFTKRALSLGVDEANPLMRILFTKSIPLATFVKLGLVTLCVSFLWRYRRHNLTFWGLLFATTIYIFVFFYHLYFLLV